MDPDYPNGLVRNFHRLSGRHCQEEFDPTFAPTGNSSNSMCREAGACMQYKEGARSSRRRYRWCSTRRVHGAVEGGTGGAVQGGEQYIQAAIANQSASRSVRTRSQSVDTTIITWEWDRITGISVMILCYCVTGISVFLGSHKSINIKLWWETYWSKLWIGLSRHSNKYNSESAIF